MRIPAASGFAAISRWEERASIQPQLLRERPVQALLLKINSDAPQRALVGLTLGSRRGFAALALYLVEGAVGMPVFNPAGLGGVAQLLGPTGGYLLAYPLVAALAGWIMERGKKTFTRAAVAGLLAEVVLFASGISWLVTFTHSFAQAVRFGLYWFVFAEVIKIMAAAAIATGWQRAHKAHS